VIEAANKDCAKDQRALATILHAVPSEMKVGLTVKRSAKEAWDAVKSMRAGDDHVKVRSMRTSRSTAGSLSMTSRCASMDSSLACASSVRRWRIVVWCRDRDAR
jgi:hypothetical protein